MAIFSPKYYKVASIFLVIIVFSLVWFNRLQLIELYSKINLFWLATGIGCYLVNYIFRSFRLKTMTNCGLSFFNQAYYFSAIHGVMSYLLPLRTGDASLPLLLKSTGKISLKKGILFLIKIRILDLTALGLFSVFGSFIGVRMISLKIQILWFSTGLFLALSFFWLKHFQWIGRILFKKEWDYCTPSIFKCNAKEIYYTALIWLFIFLGQFCTVRAIGLDLAIFEILLISAIQLPLQLIPIQGFANAGNHETGWVSAMLLMGFSRDFSIDYSLVSHGIIIIYVTALGFSAILTKRGGRA